MFKVLALTVLLSATVLADASEYVRPQIVKDPGYNYPQPSLPPATYLPPTSTRPPPPPPPPTVRTTRPPPPPPPPTVRTTRPPPPPPPPTTTRPPTVRTTRPPPPPPPPTPQPSYLPPTTRPPPPITRPPTTRATTRPPPPPTTRPPRTTPRPTPPPPPPPPTYLPPTTLIVTTRGTQRTYPTTTRPTRPPVTPPAFVLVTSSENSAQRVNPFVPESIIMNDSQGILPDAVTTKRTTTTTTRRPTTRRPETDTRLDANNFNPDGSHEAGNPFDFTWAVRDDESQNDFSHKADSDGETVKGEYRQLLPDGRVQLVKYVADWKTGYSAQVLYDGVPA